MNKVLVVAAHPDDEVLGCGGTIARHADSGDHVQVLIVAEGSTSRQQNRDRDKVRDELFTLAKAAQAAGSILGAAGVELLDFPDNRLDSLDRLDLIKRIEERIELHQPDCVYVHHSGDVNVDHRRLHEAVVTACRPVPGHVVKRLLSFEVASSTEWQPLGLVWPFSPTGLWIFQINGSASVMLWVYSNEMRAWPHARSSIRTFGTLARRSGGCRCFGSRYDKDPCPL